MRKLSLRTVGKLLGISHQTALQILVRNGRPRRSISEARMIYSKTNFSGAPAEQARHIGFVEDCGVRHLGKQIRIETGSTHPAFLQLFRQNYGKHSHVGMYSSYNKQFALYKWQVYVDLNSSFEFLPEYKKNPLKFLHTFVYENRQIYVYLGSLTDAEGQVGITLSNGHPRAVLAIYNNNRSLLEWTQETIGGHIYPVRSIYTLQLHGEAAAEALRKLHLTHAEKVAARDLILHYADNGGIGMEALMAYKTLRRRVDEDVRLCTLQARLDWITRHGKPHKDDPDHTFPTELPLSSSFFYSCFFLVLCQWWRWSCFRLSLRRRRLLHQVPLPCLFQVDLFLRLRVSRRQSHHLS